MTEGAAVDERPAEAEQRTVRRGPDGAKAVDRTARLLMELAEHPRGVTLAELARRLGDPVPTVHRALATLRAYDLVRETVDGNYAIGVSAAVLAGALAEGLDLRAEAGPQMAALRDRTGETIHLGVLSGAQIVYVEKLDSPNAVRMVSRVGGTNPALTTAIGVSILAASDQETIDRTVELSRVQYADAISPDRFEAALDATRLRGYGTDLEVNEPGICCVGAAIFDITGAPVAGISVSTPTLRFDRDRVEDLGRTVSGAAAEISRRLGYRPPTGESA
ncbi:IclR family transcriptional regulator [Leucobacter sp. CSA1]|uniref:IclR family transcriptional regulator n=1 Tax=Leucobacter chromiisoli TaxID=2796471 RepID=A0A934Q5D9_9MICO|nr:IclR family transcriptional regulator [Leucobacter chromiisoli]MBK0418649.1 IclR family transcriptional regulator [Leucobacter chromiisoli]